MKKIKLKFNLLDRVEILGNEGASYYITRIQIDASTNIIYGLLKPDGNYIWMSDSEIIKIEKSKQLGFNLLLQEVK